MLSFVIHPGSDTGSRSLCKMEQARARGGRKLRRCLCCDRTRIIGCGSNLNPRIIRIRQIR